MTHNQSFCRNILLYQLVYVAVYVYVYVCICTGKCDVSVCVCVCMFVCVVNYMIFSFYTRRTQERKRMICKEFREDVDDFVETVYILLHLSRVSRPIFLQLLVKEEISNVSCPVQRSRIVRPVQFRLDHVRQNSLY